MVPVLRLMGAMLLVVAVAQPSAAQRKHKVDPESASSRACKLSVRARVDADYPNAQKIHVLMEAAVEWQENEVETFITGQGRFERRSGSWREFGFRCIYYLRTSEVTVTDVEMGSLSDVPGDGSGELGVTLYRDLRYSGYGESFTEDVSDLRRFRIGDDQTTSVRVSRGCTARLYQDLNFRGAYTEVTADIPDLRGSRVGDDSVTSIRLRCDGQGWPTDPGDSSEEEFDDDPWSYGVTLYRDPNFRGTSQTFSEDIPDLRNSRVGDDQATSVKISRGCQARLYQDLNFRGSYTEVTSDIADLRNSRVGDDSITSLQVRCSR